MVTNKLDYHSSPVKPNSITYDISENVKASSGEINYDQEAVTEWTTKSGEKEAATRKYKFVLFQTFFL